MSAPDHQPRSEWELAVLAAKIFAVDPHGTGIRLRAGHGAQRERWLDLLPRLLTNAPLRKLSPWIADDRLIGGLDLAATLIAGAPVAEPGLLAEAHGGAIICPSAERMPPALAARIAAAHDRGEIGIERDGLAERRPSRFGLVLLDEASGEDEAPPGSLLERTALSIDISRVTLRQSREGEAGPKEIARARRVLRTMEAGEAAIEALCAACAALGIRSMRAPVQALRVAQILAALDGRDEAGEADLALSAQLTLAWRATALPGQDDDSEAPEPPPPQDEGDSPDESDDSSNAEALGEVVLDAVRAALPPDLLNALVAGDMRQRGKGAAGRIGAQRKSAIRGRRIGAFAGEPRGGKRLDLVATLKAAAPWQRLRQNAPGGVPGIRVRASDFRIRRHAERSETLTIFAVDASGSQALNRMAEAKGAVELLLAECYVRRDQVALIAFRGPGAETLLPPTRALLRARRSLRGLPAGGGTPLAAGIDAAASLAEAASRRGQAPLIVFLTDGRANLGRSGQPGREAAQADALASARHLRRAGLRALLIDTSPRPDPRASELADALGAPYIALPYVDAAVLSQAVRSAHRHG